MFFDDIIGVRHVFVKELIEKHGGVLQGQWWKILPKV